MILVDIFYGIGVLVIVIVILVYFYKFMDYNAKMVSDNAKALTPTYPWYYMPTYVMDAWGETFPICLRASSKLEAKLGTVST